VRPQVRRGEEYICFKDGAYIGPGEHGLSFILKRSVSDGMLTINIRAKTSGRIQPGIEIALVRQNDLFPATRDVGLV
jgi:hypothetical protein